MGSGRIDGRPVMVAAEDFTVKAGTISQAANAKRYRVAEIALLDRVPLVMMLDGAGYRADGRHTARTPTDLLAQGRCSGRVPLVTAVLGSSAGHGALVAPMSDFTVMSAHAAIFTAGPPVVRESLGETVTKEELGGPSVAVASGLIHNAAADDAAALDLVRRYLGYFPSSAWSYPPDVAGGDTGRASRPRDASTSCRATAGRLYEMRDVLDVVFDRVVAASRCSRSSGSPSSARSRASAAIPSPSIANQPRVLAGSVDVDGADKAAHFITVADSFHLPLVFLADNPGVHAGPRVGEARHPAQRRAHVRGADARDQPEVPRDAAQGLRLRLDGDGHDPRSTASRRCSRFPGATMGAMGAAAMSRATGADADEAERLRRGRARGVLPLGEPPRLRRADRSARDPERAAARARARALPAPGRARAGGARRILP